MDLLCLVCEFGVLFDLADLDDVFVLPVSELCEQWGAKWKW